MQAQQVEEQEQFQPGKHTNTNYLRHGHSCFLKLGSEYTDCCSFSLQHFASPYPAVTANSSGPWQNLIDVANLDCKETKRDRSYQNVAGWEETYKRP